MDLITKPMLACGLKDADLDKLKYPVAGTPKIDGIRCLRPTVGPPLSRSFKPIQNLFIRGELERILPVGADGEILAGSSFQEVTHSVMGHDGRPDFSYKMFDYVSAGFDQPYLERMAEAKRWWRELYERNSADAARIEILDPTLLANKEALLAFERCCIEDGYEGIVVRDPNGPYKNGRSTLREGFLLKLKRFVDAEATVVDFEELESNGNAPSLDAFGRTQRSSCKEGMVPLGTLGALVVEDAETGMRFNVGTGFDQATRREIWDARGEYLGRTVKYKYFPVGVKELPRHPVFLGFRDPADMDAEGQ